MTQTRLADWLRWPRRRPNGIADFESLALALLSGKGEASGVALASRLLDAYAALPEAARPSFFELLLRRFGPDEPALQRALDAYARSRDADTLMRLHAAAEPRRQELVRRMNLAPGGTQQLVRMREHRSAAGTTCACASSRPTGAASASFTRLSSASRSSSSRWR